MTCFQDGTHISIADKEAYIYEDYLFEKINSLSYVQEYSTNSETGEKTLVRSVEKFVLTGYILTDLKTQQCFEFDTSSIKSKVIRKYNVDKKKSGIQLNLDVISLYQIDLSKVMKPTDTLINNNKYLSIRDTVYKATGVPPNWPLYSAKIYINKDLKGFPVNLSTILAKQYNGFVDGIDLETSLPNSSKKSIVSFRCTYNEGLNDEEITLIKKFKGLITN